MKRSFVTVLAGLLALVLAAVLVPALAGSTAPGGAPGAAPLGTQAAEARAAFVSHLSSHAPLIRSGAAPGVVGGPASLLSSVNWSGFADVETGSQKFSGVSGSWTVPSLTCPTGLYRYQGAFADQWVGVDGATNGTVEQVGTGAECFEGVTHYYVWYDMYPSAPVVEGAPSCSDENVDCPKPGDPMKGSVTVTPGGSGVNDYTLSLTDTRNSVNDFSVTKTCATGTCLDQSAEWIVERPAIELAFGLQEPPLVDFSQTGFSHAKQVSGGTSAGISGFTGGPVDDLAMVDDSTSYYLDCVGQTGSPGELLLTSNPDACPAVSPTSGNSFTLTWDSSF